MKTNTPFVINVKNGTTQDPYPGSKPREPIYSCLKVNGIEPIARQSILSDERHMLFYSETKGETKGKTKGEARQLSIVDHFTLEYHIFTSKELSKAAWPQRDLCELAAWHSGSVLLYHGDIDPTDRMVLRIFHINLNESSLRQGSEIEIPTDFRCFKITAMSIDQNQIYVAFDSQPRKLLVFKRGENAIIARLAMPTEPGSPNLTKITDIVIRKGRIAAVTSLGHIAIWDQQLSAGASNNNVDILPGRISTKVDSLNLGLGELIEQISMSQNCERIVVLDPLWCDNTAYITQSPETVRTIPARKHGKVGESFLRVDEECRIAAVGVISFGVKDATTPLLNIFAADGDELQMTVPQFGPNLGSELGQFLDFSLHRNSVKYYGTEGIISIDFAEVRSLPDDVYTCSRNIPLSSAWSVMKYILENSG